MQLLDQPTLPTALDGLESPVLNAHSPSGRWQLTATPAPNHKVSVAFWLNQAGQAHLLRRWEVPGPQAARAFASRLKRQLGHLPDLAPPSQVLALLPIHAQSTHSTHRHPRRAHQAVGRLSGA